MDGEVQLSTWPQVLEYRRCRLQRRGIGEVLTRLEQIGVKLVYFLDRAYSDARGRETAQSLEMEMMELACVLLYAEISSVDSFRRLLESCYSRRLHSVYVLFGTPLPYLSNSSSASTQQPQQLHSIDTPFMMVEVLREVWSNAPRRDEVASRPHLKAVYEAVVYLLYSGDRNPRKFLEQLGHDVVELLEWWGGAGSRDKAAVLQWFNAQRGPDAPNIGGYYGHAVTTSHQYVGGRDAGEERRRRNNEQHKTAAALGVSRRPNNGTARAPIMVEEESIEEGPCVDQGLITSVDAPWVIRDAASRIVKRDVLASGAFGVVFSGEYQDASGRSVPVAIKEMKVPGDPSEVMLQWELRDHPFIVRLYGAVLTDDGSRITTTVMELGRASLWDKMKEWRKTRSWPMTVQRLSLGMEVCKAVEALFTPQIVHRDLKPHNFIVFEDRDGRMSAKLSDFGSAIRYDPKAPYRRSHGTTLLYRAPEIPTDGASPASDVYALAMTLFELMVMQSPFRSRGLSKGPLWLQSAAADNPKHRPTVRRLATLIHEDAHFYRQETTRRHQELFIREPQYVPLFTPKFMFEEVPFDLLLDVSAPKRINGLPPRN